MSRRPKIHYTETQIVQMWDRWQRGESLHQIARLFDRHHSSARRILSATGGIRPAARHRSERVLTLAEREEISRALMIKHARKLPQELYRSLTWDRGSEMAQHQRFTLATDIKVYFCDPYNPWQRGPNENTSGLLRQYFPKGMDLSGVTQAQLNAVARRLNGRPRKTLNFETPAERFHQFVATTG